MVAEKVSWCGCFTVGKLRKWGETLGGSVQLCKAEVELYPPVPRGGVGPLQLEKYQKI